MLAFEAELAHLPRSLISAVWEAFDTLSSMTWKPSDDVEREVRNWMTWKGWEVSPVYYDSERQVYAWHHDVRGGPSPNLRISRQVLESYPAFVLLYHLAELKVNRVLRTSNTLSLFILY